MEENNPTTETEATAAAYPWIVIYPDDDPDIKNSTSFYMTLSDPDDDVDEEERFYFRGKALPRKPDLKTMQTIVEGDIEFIPIMWYDPIIKKMGYQTLICNEEGKIKSLLYNNDATALVGMNDYIFGRVILYSDKK